MKKKMKKQTSTGATTGDDDDDDEMDAAGAVVTHGDAPVVLPMCEDLVAHGLLKRLMQFEGCVEMKMGDLLLGGSSNGHGGGGGYRNQRELLASDELLSLLRDDRSKKGHVEVDESFWIDPYSLDEKHDDDDNDGNSNGTSLAHRLLNLLAHNVNGDIDQEGGDGDSGCSNGFDKWLQQNRSCFNLVRLFSLPSTIGLLHRYITEEQLQMVGTDDDGGTALHEGGKVLLKLSIYAAKL